VFCQIFDSYGLALILFTLVVKIILFPLSLKGKKSMIKMNLAQADLKAIQKRCGNDRERYNQEVQKYYSEHNISPTGGCGWSMIPLLILMPLYAIIRRPMKYMMRLTENATGAVAKALNWVGVHGSEFSLTGTGAAGRSAAYNELTLASMINEGNLDTAIGAAAGVGSIFVINFNFLGMNLADIPNWKFWEGGITWNSVGLFLLPIISAGLSIVSMIVSQRTNRMSASDPTTNSTSKSMMFISPLISLWIGFTLPAGLCVYWIANSAFMMLQEWLCGMILRKDYEAARVALEEQKKREKEEEKQRRREAAERKAAAIAAGKGKNKKTQPQAKEKGVDASASREGLRAHARGRNYDPNRYPTTPYVDPNQKNKKPEPELEPLTEEEKTILTEAGIEIPEENTVEVETAVEQETAVEVESEPEGEFEEAYAPESEEPKEE